MDSKQASQVTTGSCVVAIGLILLAGQLDLDWDLDFGRLWPLIFVVIGARQIPEQRDAAAAASGSCFSAASFCCTRTAFCRSAARGRCSSWWPGLVDDVSEAATVPTGR